MRNQSVRHDSRNVDGVGTSRTVAVVAFAHLFGIAVYLL